MRWLTRALVAMLLQGALFSGASFAEEEARVILQSTVTGNQEQPKVLYIVPWQAPGGADHLRQPLQPIVDDILISVDRDEFRRELEYRDALAAPAAP